MEAAPGVRPRKRKWKKALLPWMFLLPALLMTMFVVMGPTVGTLALSLTDWDGIRPPHFIGADNYKSLMKDPNFFAALENNFRWMALFCTIPVVFGLIVASVVSKAGKGQMFYRSAFFLPQIVSTVVSAKIWAWIYNPFFGINTVLQQWGIQNVPLWLGNPKIALYSVALVDGWRYWGFLMVLFLSALHQTDRALEEAAKVDGASRIRIFWHVMLPQLRPTISLILMMTMIWSFAAFDYVFVMTNGGPGNATELIGTYMYKQALQNQMPGYASTIALAMALLSGIIMALFGILRKRGWDV
ncbi:sugar ABC transporter permease [Cohnella endophytica]|uniref:Sugar ABC transporter permease n=2 Tax=Cohnella endophytica TaxID=2419778 RepID=A0A494XPT9_9BACL|nr:sugar ABC transporter permease [Cohnella endophytica]